MIRNNNALSEVIGFVLLLAIVVVVLSFYVTYVVPATGRETEIAQMNRISTQFTDYKFTLDNIRTSILVNNLSPVMTSTAFSLGTGGSSTSAGGLFIPLLKPAASFATISVYKTTDTFDVDSSSYHAYRSALVDFPFNITSFEYTSHNNYWIQQKYSYQLGGVFLSQDDGVTSRISPLIAITSAAEHNNKTYVVNIAPVQVVGGGTLSGTGPARVDTRERILPKYNISTDPYIANSWVNLSVTSSSPATAAMWLNVFNDTAVRSQLDPLAYKTGTIYNAGNKTTTAYISVTGTNADPAWKDVSLYVQRAEFYVALNNIASGVT